MNQDVGPVLVSRYRLTGALGRGGMGAVWRAHDGQLGRDVAVKELRLPERLTAAERENWIARLDREARAAARLKHPGIITVHDRVTGEDGRPWIVMELIHGGSLGDLLRSEGPLPVEQVARIGLQVLAALRAAHQAGITHRDIKPANILLEQDRVVLTDFGIAAVDGDATLTASGMLMGTPAFMAPEQVRGLPATAESDLWSLGATLYTAVEGHPPFAGTNPGAVLISVATQDPAPARRAGPLGPVLNGLLRKHPAERLTLDHLHAMLTHILSDWHAPVGQWAPGPVHDSPVGAPPRPLQPPADVSPAPRRGRPARTVLVIAAVLALVAGAAAGGYLLYDRGRTDETARVYQANLRAARELGVPPGFSRLPETRLPGGKARLTYAAPMTCVPTRCEPLMAVQRWLTSQPGVAAVYPPGSDYNIQSCREPGDCPVSVTPSGQPPILNGQWYAQDRQLFFQIDVG